MKLMAIVLLLPLPNAVAQPPAPADKQEKQGRAQVPALGDGAAGMGEAMGMAFMQRLLGGPAAPPTVLHEGNILLIIENGSVYKVNVETMELEGTVQYRRPQAEGNPLAALLGMAQAKKEARPAPDAVQPGKPGKAAPTRKRPAPAPADEVVKPKDKQ